MENKNEVHMEKYFVPGLVRGINILKLFTNTRKVITGPEMAQALKIPRTTVFRIAQTLEHLGLLEKVEHSQAFRLGIGVLSLGYEYVASLDISELGRLVLDKLSNNTGLSSHLVIRDKSDAVVIYKSQGQSAFSSSLQVGTRLPTHATVLGRMLIMELNENELQYLFPHETLPSYTKQTPKVFTELLDILAQDRKRGYAVSNSFFESGISSVSAPVRGPSGMITGALNVTITRNKIESVEQEDIIQAVVLAAKQLSLALNYRQSDAINQ